MLCLKVFFRILLSINKNLRKKISLTHIQKKIAIHIPTYFYDSPSFFKNFSVDPDECFEIEALNYDVSINKNRICLVDDGNFEGRYAYPDVYFSEYIEELSSTFNKISINNSFDLKFELIGHRLRQKFQLNVWRDLIDHNVFKDVKKLFITNHDGGLTGPIISSALQSNVDTINVLPHSTLQNIPFVTHEKIIFHNLYANSSFLRLDENKINIKNTFYPFNNPVPRINSNKMKLLLVLGPDIDTFGIPYVDFCKFNQELDCFLDSLPKDKFDLGLRYKLNNNAIKIDKQFTNCLGPQANWLNWPDICISFFTPTSFTIPFQQNGILCLHIQDRPLVELERCFQVQENCITLSGSPYNNLFKLAAEILKNY